jgi:hypothetical protein
MYETTNQKVISFLLFIFVNLSFLFVSLKEVTFVSKDTELVAHPQKEPRLANGSVVPSDGQSRERGRVRRTGRGSSGRFP